MRRLTLLPLLILPLLAAAQDFRIGLPGMLLQIGGGWAVIHLVIRR